LDKQEVREIGRLEAGQSAGLPGLFIGIMVAGFQHEGKEWEDQDQLKMEKRCCWAEWREMC